MPYQFGRASGEFTQVTVLQVDEDDTAGSHVTPHRRRTPAVGRNVGVSYPGASGHPAQRTAAGIPQEQVGTRYAVRRRLIARHQDVHAVRHPSGLLVRAPLKGTQGCQGPAGPRKGVEWRYVERIELEQAFAKPAQRGIRLRTR